PDTGVGGSRVTHLAGQAALEAAQEVRARLVAAAADRLGAVPEAVRLEGGQFTAGVAVASFAAVAAAAVSTMGDAGGVIAARITHATRHVEAMPTFQVQVAEVAVDPETGQVRLQRLTTVHDVGTILNPVLHQGQ